MSCLTVALATAKRRSSFDFAASNINARGLSQKIRALLRETAQPVAVVTSLMPSVAPPPPRLHPVRPAPAPTSGSAQPSPESIPSTPTFHGATLSSFTSVSMAPHNLVAFSLRVPSRMATTLSDLSSATATAAPSSSSSSSSSPVHMVINILAAPQAHTAVLFSRPDLHPRPFEDPGIQWSLSRDGLPILHGSLGALSCRVVGAPWPLNDLSALGDKMMHETEGTSGSVDAAGGVESELFIAQVMRVEDVPRVENVGYDDSIRTLPLVYHRRGYTTTADKLLLNQKADS